MSVKPISLRPHSYRLMDILKARLVTGFDFHVNRGFIPLKILAPVLLADKYRLIQVGKEAPPNARRHNLRARAIADCVNGV